MRLFTAIDLPPDIVDQLQQLIAKLRPLAPISWSKIENLHITTKFIGQWPEDRLPELTGALAELPKRVRIPIRVQGLGFYPSKRSPNVFWAGVEAPPGLTALANDTDTATAALGIEPESRAYSPHLTLARIKKPTDLKSFHHQIELTGNPAFGSFQADRFYLYLSKPGPGGSVYTKLSEFPFTS